MGPWLGVSVETELFVIIFLLKWDCGNRAQIRWGDVGYIKGMLTGSPQSPGRTTAVSHRDHADKGYHLSSQSEQAWKLVPEITVFIKCV